jgi:hypothetical protein
MTLSAVNADPAKKQDFTHEFMAGLESYKYHYGESTPKHSNFMQYNGMMFGLSGSYELTYKGSVFLRPEARIAYGFTTYSNYETIKFPKASIPNLTFEPRLLVGGDIYFSKNFKLSPYVGFGYRYKSDDGSNVVDNQNGRLTKRFSQYYYVPLGSRLTYDFKDRWFIKAMAEYDWFISGRHFEYFTDGTYPSPLVYKQKRGWGAKSELLVGHHFDKVSVAFGPYMNYWKVGKTKGVKNSINDELGLPLVGFRNEPKNVTKEIGVKLNFYF